MLPTNESRDNLALEFQGSCLFCLYIKRCMIVSLE